MNAVVMALIGVGDHTAAGAAALAGAIFLVGTRNWKAGAILLAAVVVAGGTIGALKALFIGCDLYLSDIDVRYPSGHAALSAATLGTVGMFVAGQVAGWRRLVVVTTFLAVEACIAIGLVAMGFHTVYETLIGLLVGSGAAGLAFLLARLVRPARIRPVHIRGLVLVVAIVVSVNNVARAQPHDLAGWLGNQVQTRTSMCAFMPQFSLTDAAMPVHLAAIERRGVRRV